MKGGNEATGIPEQLTDREDMPGKFIVRFLSIQE
jgi:hypothetical protein